MERAEERKLIDFSDPFLRTFLPVLLQDHTTGKNIIWATDPPPELGVGFADEITLEQLGKVQLVPRVQKRLADQKKRTGKKAEVFTPSWICDKMNTMLDEERKQEGWKEYINHNVLEVTCGEAPFLTSRYDTTTGQMIAVPDRIGLLDRKLNVLAEQFNDYDMWMCWAISAYASTYGYEWQGDNILLARCNLFLTLIENFRYRFDAKRLKIGCMPMSLDCIAEIISWNVWQMDGLKKTVPGTDIPCKIKDWKADKEILFKDVGEEKNEIS